MTTDELLKDLDARLRQAAENLASLASTTEYANQREQVDRLMAKREGVLLARDYLRAYGTPHPRLGNYIITCNNASDETYLLDLNTRPVAYCVKEWRNQTWEPPTLDAVLAAVEDYETRLRRDAMDQLEVEYREACDMHGRLPDPTHPPKENTQ